MTDMDTLITWLLFFAAVGGILFALIAFFLIGHD